MQTAVQFIEKKLDNLLELYTSEWKKVNEVLEQAKEMEKQQIIDAYDTNRDINTIQTANEYYNETYGSSEHIVDTNEMIDHIGEANEMVEKSEKPIIPEISDEEIEKMLFHHSNEYAYGFKDAIKWYKEQLKQRQ